MKKFNAAWYLFVIEGGDNAILVTKNGIWYSDMMVDLWWKHYGIDINDVAGTIDGIRTAINAGECFDASDMVDEINADYENMGKRFSRISEYDGLTADEIDTTSIIDIIEI